MSDIRVDQQQFSLTDTRLGQDRRDPYFLQIKCLFPDKLVIRIKTLQGNKVFEQAVNALGLPFCCQDIFLDLVFIKLVHFQHFKGTGNGMQRVSDFVSDTGRHFTNGRQPLLQSVYRKITESWRAA